MAGFLIDTNVLVYSYDSADARKRDLAIAVVDQTVRSGTGVLSTQVLGEFFVAVRRKITPPLSNVEAARSITNYIDGWLVLDVTALIVAEAVRGVVAHQLQYHDALIWATARLNQVTNVLTEDGHHGRVIEGVRYLDPFQDDFDLAALTQA